MELSEERELNRISAEFAKGIEAFRKRQYQEALSVFDSIINDEVFKSSESKGFYSIVEIVTRSKVYKNICQTQLHPVVVSLEEDEDYLFDGLVHLNAGNIDKAFERFNCLKEKNYNNHYLYYLLSLAYLKKDDKESSFNYLRKAIEMDATYKLIAHNEPDFDFVFDNQEFLQLIDQNPKIE